MTPEPTRPTQFGRIHAPDEAWLARQAARADPRSRPAHDRHPPSPLGAPRPSLLPAGLPRRREHRSPAGRLGVRRVRVDVSRRRARGDAPGGRDGVRGRAGRDERQRPLRRRRAWPRASSASPTSRWATAWSRCWRPTCARAGDASAASATRRRSTRARSSATATSASGPHLLREPAFRAGLTRLAALGLSLDAWVFHPQLADVVDLARAFPRANIVVGHCGGPLGYGPYAGKRDEVFGAWKPSDRRAGPVPRT